MNITFSAGKNTVEVLCMTEKTGLEKTVVFNLKSANESDVNNIVNEKGHESHSFYYKLGLLYFLNIVDWISGLCIDLQACRNRQEQNG